MKKATILLSFLTLFGVLEGYCQVFVPKQLQGYSQDTSTVKLSKIYENYRELKNSADSSLAHDKKEADRWIYNQASRMNAYNDSTYNFNDYSKAFKLFVENGPFCNSEDISDWKNIGPKNVQHRNGWVSAVHYDPTNEYYLLGARQAGIFRSTDGGDHWICVTDNLPYPIIGIRQIEVNPTPLFGNNLIAITGDDSSPGPIQNNILLSSDYGQSWSLGSNQYLALDGTLKDLNQVQEVRFNPNISNMVVGLTTDKIIMSNDGGLNWRQLEFPNDYAATAGEFENIVISGNTIHITQLITNELNTNYWSGDITLYSGNYLVNWSQNRSGEFHETPVEILSDATPYSLDFPMNLNNIGQSDPSWYHHHLSTNYGCNPNFAPYANQNVGGWEYIHTPGWDEVEINGVNKLTCNYSGQSINNKEITTEKVSVSIWLWNQPGLTGEGIIDCKVPKGATLKIYASSIYHNNNGLSLAPWTICSYPLYDEIIFENEIYTSPAATSGDLDLQDVFEFNPNEYFMRSPGTQEQAQASDQTFLIYYVLEYDPSIPSVEYGEFILNEFDLRVANNISPHTIIFSNTLNNRFFAFAQGLSYSKVYKTLNNGTSYTPLSGTSTIQGFGQQKHLFLASPNNPDMFYMGGTPYQIRRVDINSGGNYYYTSLPCLDYVDSHKDFRSGKIFSISGRDYIVAGNDGGIIEVNTADANAQTNSINGDIVINMAYNLDVHEKGKTVVVGLQDNGTAYFYEGINGRTTIDGGDGSIAMVQRPSQPLSNSLGFVVGDPQDDDDGALKDELLGTTPPTGIVDPNVKIKLGEAYLGMRLEEYKYDPKRFIVGIQNAELDSNVIMNRGIGQTERVEVSGSKRIEAIALCQNYPSTVYVADGIGRDAGQTKLYKTTDDGYNWSPVNSTLSFPNHPTVNSMNLKDDVNYKYINALGVDHDDPNLVYIGMSGIGEINQVVTNEYFRVLRSFDGGNNFTDWSEGLPALPVNYLLPIESQNHIIFCATDAGVYYRMDDMPQWECFSNNLAKTRITDLSYNYCSRELYASTYGRGVWKTPVNLETYSTYAEDIVGNVTWNTDRDVRSNVRVTSGATLTITSTVHVDADRKFIVEPGAKLLIDNGTLTNACGQYWKGIEVVGDHNQPQDLQYQGQLITQNNAKIEFAKEAISTWEVGNYATTGGIVHCTNTQFVNNRTSAYFYPYQDIDQTTSIETLNVGFMTNCEFLWDDNYIDKGPEAGVIMYNVNGVNIKGCDFIDSRSNLTGGDSRPKGIFSLDAGYKVIARNTTTGPLPTHEIFSTAGGYDVNHFKNLEYGIYSLGANSARTITADHCKFENVVHGINLSAVDNAVLTRNLVDYNASHPTDIGTSQGIEISESTGYTIQGNTFNNYDAEAFVNGVLAFDTGSEDNEVRLNYFNDQFLANYAKGNNSNTDPSTVANGDLHGLSWLCNEGVENKFDLANYAEIGIDGEGVRLEQGNQSVSAGNKFTDVGYSGLSAQILHTDDDIMKYYFDNVSGEPTFLDGAIQTELALNAEACESIFQDIIVEESRMMSSSSESQLLTEVVQLDQEIQTNKTELQLNLSDGDDAQLHQMVATITPSNKHIVRDSLYAASPYLSRQLLEELGEKPLDCFSHVWYTALVQANIEVARSDAFMSYLETKTNPLPSGLYNQIDSMRFVHFTDRGQKEMEINRLSSKRHNKANLLLVNELSDSSIVDWNEVQFKMIQRNNKVCRAEVSDQFLGRGKANECLALLDSIDQNLSDYTLDHEHQEMQDFSAFKRYVLNITNNTGTVEELDETQIQELTTMADQFTGRAAIQARNLLCFHAGLCEERAIVLPPNSKHLMNSNESNEVEMDRTVSGAELKVIPNPNKGEFVLEVPKECSIAKLSIVDITGKEVPFENLEQIENTNRILILNKETGILFLKAQCDNDSVYSTRIVVNK